MRLSVVIPAYNEERLLPSTLLAVAAAIEPLTTRGWSSEVIVTDNNSTDGTGRVAREAGAKVVFEPVNMIARARNAGAAAATGDWLVFVDADSRPSPNLMNSMAKVIQSGRCYAGGATVRLDGGGTMAGWVATGWNWVSRIMRLPAGSFYFVDAAVFRDVGGFPAELYAAEEIELSRRLRRSPLAKGRKRVILASHPLVTSARKVSLYGPGELLAFSLRALLRPGATLRRREACGIWYDGRR